MQTAVLRSLEFDRIRDALASRTATPLGRARIAGLEPAHDATTVRGLIDLTVEAVTFSREGGSLAIGAPDDLADVLGQLDIQDQPLEPLALRGLARFLSSVEAVASAVQRAGGTRLRNVASAAASFFEETAAVERAIEPSGDVSDRASAALRDIRDSLRRQRAKLRSSLDSLSRDRDSAKYLQDQIVTDRNGRYVLVVRAEHRDAIPGIVHGSSASGASLYLEPLATVSLNNDVVALAEKERAEIQRILTALTNAFRLRGDELEATIDVAAALDELYAKVDLASRMDAVAPAITTDGTFELIGARHPLLIPSIRDLTDDSNSTHSSTSASPVASTLSLVPPTRALVISGPNTGGKTVALKAFGLLSLMAQAGLLIPVETGSRLTPFRSVFADIGDDQSISNSLSTFSAHVANIVDMERALELPALVLLDEVGSGTDPVEGGALGAAIVDHFRRRGALVVATTHDDILKTYAATTPGVSTAGFGFNPETYAPTYRLIYGAPGRSLALEIAERLGLTPDVIADARSRTTGRESQLSAHLAQLDSALARAEHDRAQVAAERAALAAERQKLFERESKLTEREAVLRKRLDERVNEKLREARAEVDQIVGTLKKKAETLATEADRRESNKGSALTTGQMGQLRREATAALSTVAETMTSPTETDIGEALSETPEVGDRVFVVTLQAEGVVRSLSGRKIDVDVRGLRTRTALSDLRRPGTAHAGSRGPQPASPRRVQIDVAPRDSMAARELVLVGQTVDQAIERAGKFLDDALIADERRLRVVHGHGTGRLREALAAFFREHPLVASVSAASEREGGNAATIVELKE
jgi:DNA mismatch repair protein MutS2